MEDGAAMGAGAAGRLVPSARGAALFLAEVVILGPAGPLISRAVRGVAGALSRSWALPADPPPREGGGGDEASPEGAALLAALRSLRPPWCPQGLGRRLRRLPRGLAGEAGGALLCYRWLILYALVHNLNGRRKARKRAMRTATIHLLRNPSMKSLARILHYLRGQAGPGADNLNAFITQNFASVDQVSWLNELLGQLWPRIDVAVAKIIENQLREPLNAARPAGISSLGFDEFTLGSTPPEVESLRHVPTFNPFTNGITLQAKVTWQAQPHITFAVRGPAIYGGMSPLLAQVEDLAFSGTLHVTLKPVLPIAPLVGGVSIMFTREPWLNYNIKVKTTPGVPPLTLNIVPGLKPLLLHLLDGVFRDLLVFPNNIRIPVTPPGMEVPYTTEEVDNMLKIQPVGRLSVTVKSCVGLRNRSSGLDKLAVFKGDPDPYVQLGVVLPRDSGSVSLLGGARPEDIRKTVTVRSCTDPSFEETMVFPVSSLDLQVLAVEVMDLDITTDELLGAVRIDLAFLRTRGTQHVHEAWFPLMRGQAAFQGSGEGRHSHGDIHLRLVWEPFQSLAKAFDKMTEEDGALTSALRGQTGQRRTMLNSSSMIVRKPGRGPSVRAPPPRIGRGLGIRGAVTWLPRGLGRVLSRAGGGGSAEQAHAEAGSAWSRAAAARMYNPFAVPAGYTRYQAMVEEVMIRGRISARRRRKPPPPVPAPPGATVGPLPPGGAPPGVGRRTSHGSDADGDDDASSSAPPTDEESSMAESSLGGEAKRALKAVAAKVEVDAAGMPRGTGNSWRPPKGLGPLSYVGLRPADTRTIRTRDLLRMLRAADMSEDGLTGGLPAWAVNPSMERVLWIDMLVAKLWKAMREMVRWEIHDANRVLQATLPRALDVAVDARAGLLPLVVVEGIEVHRRSDDLPGIVVDVALKVAGDAEAAAAVRWRRNPLVAMGLRVSQVTASATLRVQLQPLLPTLPLLGAISISTLGDAHADLSCLLRVSPLLPAVDITASPLFSPLLRQVMRRVVRPLVAFPAAATVPIVDLRDPRIKGLLVDDVVHADTGVLSVRVVRARGLGAAATSPYLRICAGFKDLTTRPYGERFQRSGGGRAADGGAGGARRGDVTWGRAEFHFLVEDIQEVSGGMYLTVGAFQPEISGTIRRGFESLLPDVITEANPNCGVDAERALDRMQHLVERSEQLMADATAVDGDTSSIPWSKHVLDMASKMDWYLARKREVQKAERRRGSLPSDTEHPMMDWLGKAQVPSPNRVKGEIQRRRGGSEGSRPGGSLPLSASPSDRKLAHRLRDVSREDDEGASGGWAKLVGQRSRAGLNPMTEMVGHEVGLRGATFLGAALVKVAGLSAGVTVPVWVPLEGGGAGAGAAGDEEGEEPPEEAEVQLEITWRPHRSLYRQLSFEAEAARRGERARGFSHWVDEAAEAATGPVGRKQYGALLIDVIRAEGLRTPRACLLPNLVGRLRPQVEVHAGVSARRTAAGYGPDPTWNAHVQFNHVSPEDFGMALEVRVYDCGPAGIRKRLGHGALSLTDVIRTGSVSSTVSLNGGKGDVMLRLAWKEEAAAAARIEYAPALAPVPAAANTRQPSAEPASILKPPPQDREAAAAKGGWIARRRERRRERERKQVSVTFQAPETPPGERAEGDGGSKYKASASFKVMGGATIAASAE